MVTVRLFLVLSAIGVTCACAPGPTLTAKNEPASEPEIRWVEVGSWHGRGTMQTESFFSDAGMLRVTWKTAHETGKDGGILRLSLSSGISGRPLEMLADQHGLGRGEAYSAE